MKENKTKINQNKAKTRKEKIAVINSFTDRGTNYALETPGALNLSKEVIKKIIILAAIEVQGVLVHKQKVSVNFIGETLSVSIQIALKEGTRPIIAGENVQKNIKNNLQSMTGLTVSKINVKIIKLIPLQENT